MGILDELLQQIDGEPEVKKDQVQSQDPAPDDGGAKPDDKPYDAQAKDSNWYGEDFKKFAGIE